MYHLKFHYFDFLVKEAIIEMTNLRKSRIYNFIDKHKNVDVLTHSMLVEKMRLSLNVGLVDND